MEFLVNEEAGPVVHEEEDLLVIDKPAGVATHAPSPLSPEGIYEWMRRRHSRWGGLAIMHRLDKETSGVMVFSKSSRGNRSLTRQFTEGRVRKVYHFETDRSVDFREKRVESALVRSGERQVVRPAHAGAEMAVTQFRFEAITGHGSFLWRAEPLTGKTHQIRAQAASIGLPILGDALYGGREAGRLFLHATELRFKDPDGAAREFQVAPDFSGDSRRRLRAALFDPRWTDSFRLIHGAADGWPGWSVDKLGDSLLSMAEAALTPAQEKRLRQAAETEGSRAVYEKTLLRKVSKSRAGEASPRLWWGEPKSGEFFIRENGVRFAVSFDEGYSCGLFLDQRENRRRWLMGAIEPGEPIFAAPTEGRPEVLNLFAYTCGFSVCAARTRARVTSIDLSRRYLDWGKRNFSANDCDPREHDFIHGDVFEWMRRLERKGRRFDVVIADPPTFSRSKSSGVFQVERDFPKLLEAVHRLLKPGGVILASSNAGDWKSDDFMATLRNGARAAGREVCWLQFSAQPLDFPVSKLEPAYLKTAWMRVT